MTSLDQQLFETLMPSQPMGNGFEDFFDFDMLLASSSRSSSRSPAHSPAFPPTPPQPTADADASLYGFGLFDEYAKPANPLAAFPPAQPYDFSAILGAGAVTGSPASSSATAVSPSLAIDPQLVDSPSPPQDEEDHDDDQDDEEEPEPLKVGGKGKHRKGTVQSGGVQKKVKVVEKKELEDADDWRPSPEEYKKMSSKEKRQLRNKISARNFRNRRKEYINTLEGDIADRDRLIDAIRNELGSTKSENVALREEIDALKKALLQGREGPVLPPPGPLPEIPAAITAATATPKPSTPLISPNLHKDMPSSSRNAARAFRPGNSNSFSNFMPVHTTLIPEFPSIFANTQHISAADLAGKHTEPAEIAVPSLQENMNPALNSLPPHHGQTPMSGVHAFDAFADVNPFTLKTLDAYRMQLWGRMALAQQQQRRQQWQTQTQAQTQGSPLPGGLASELRPAFFTSSAKANVSTAVLAGKAAAASTPAPLPGTLAAAQAQHNAQVDMATAMVGQSMLQRLGGAFWDAFAGTDKKAGSVDTDKLRRVLEGKAVVRVVDVEEPAPKANVRPTMAPQQTVRPQQMQRSPSAPSPKMSPRLGPSVSSCPSSVVTDILEESMRALTISKKSPPV